MAKGKKNSTTKKRKRTTKVNNSSNTQRSVDNMKYEIANEFGVKLGAGATSRENGLVGGEMTKRLVQRGLNKKSSKSKNK